MVLLLGRGRRRVRPDAANDAMKPAPFDYVAPTTVEEALQVLAEAGGGATVLAGGQTLMPLLSCG